jgi:hypothetical protein
VGNASSRREKWKLELGSVCGMDGVAIRQENREAGIGDGAIGVWCSDVNVVPSASGVSNAGGRNVLWLGGGRVKESVE